MRTTAIALCLAASPLVAQTSNTVPTGYDNVDGNSTFSHWGGTAGRVLQILDHSQDQVRVINQISFRRSTATVSGAVAGTMDAEVVMAECNFTLLSPVFVANQQKNVAKTFSGQVNLPDWTVAGPGTPGPFDLTMKFNQPWVFRAAGAGLVITVTYKNSTTNNRSMDRASGSVPANTGTAITSGCANFDDYTRFYNSGAHKQGPAFHLRFAGDGAPANAPVFLLLDTVDQDLTVPGLCAKLHCDLQLISYLGQADANGDVLDKYLNLPRLVGLENATIYSQLLTVDTTQPGLPFLLTGGRATKIPANSATTASSSGYQWEADANATVNSGGYITFGGAPIVELQ